MYNGKWKPSWPGTRCHLWRWTFESSHPDHIWPYGNCNMLPWTCFTTGRTATDCGCGDCGDVSADCDSDLSRVQLPPATPFLKLRNPMWTFQTSTGQLSNEGGDVVATGYSGHGDGKNNPAMQEIHDVGPIPVGTYTIGPPFQSDKHGPYAMSLTPAASDEMFGRSGFMMHGDSKEHPGGASEGCVIMPRNIREMVWSSGDHQLLVIA